MANVLVTTDSTFKEDISKGFTFVDFWAEWCWPCRAMNPIIEELSKQVGDKVKIMKMNVDLDPLTAQSLWIRWIPSMKIFKNWIHLVENDLNGMNSLENILNELKKAWVTL